MSDEWLATVSSWGFSIGSDGVREWKDGVEIAPTDERAAELESIFRFAVGESIAELVLPPSGEAVQATRERES
jgi:hypothetical protein